MGQEEGGSDACSWEAIANSLNLLEYPVLGNVETILDYKTTPPSQRSPMVARKLWLLSSAEREKHEPPSFKELGSWGFIVLCPNNNLLR